MSEEEYRRINPITGETDEDFREAVKGKPGAERLEKCLKERIDERKAKRLEHLRSISQECYRRMEGYCKWCNETSRERGTHDLHPDYPYCCGIGMTLEDAKKEGIYNGEQNGQ